MCVCVCVCVCVCARARACVCARGWAGTCAGGVRFSNSNRIIPSDYRILHLLKMPIPTVKQLSKHSSVLGVVTEHSSGVPFNLDELARLSKIKAINQYTGQYELCLDYKK